MTNAEIIRMSVGLGVPVLATPLVIWGLRPLFTLFIAEGTELFTQVPLRGEESRNLGGLMAKLNVVVLLVAWLALFTCLCFDQPIVLLMSIALSGVGLAILITMFVLKTNLGLPRGELLIVSLISCTGGNLPLIVVGAILMALL